MANRQDRPTEAEPSPPAGEPKSDATVEAPAQSGTTPRPEPRPDPTVEAPALISISKGYDPRTPNPKARA